MAKVLYPGSFDPITKGHMNVIEQASKLFDEVIIAVMINPDKKTPMFTIEEKLAMIDELYKNVHNIRVISGSGATVDVAVNNDCKAIVRGLRSATDYAYEVQTAQINKEISNNQINTVCLFADKEYEYVSSSSVKEVLRLGKDISRYVDPFILEKIIEKNIN